MTRAIYILLLLCILAPVRAGVILATDFERNPVSQGWGAGYLCYWGWHANWVQRAEGGHCLEVRNGRARSPRFPVVEEGRYRLTFAAKGPGRPMWTIYFYNTRGELLAYDHYGGVEPSEAWGTQTHYFTTKYPGVAARVVFDTGGQGTLLVDDVTVETATLSEMDAAVAALERALPAITMPPATEAEARLPHIHRKLREGRPVRIVFLGDSIGNDLSNAPLDVLLARAYPTTQLELRFTGRGSTGYDIFQRSVDSTVIKHKPDLLILLCITNRLETDLADNVQRIIDDTRAALPRTDILLVTPHVDVFSPNQMPGSAQREILRAVAEKNGLPMVDLLAAWQDYQQVAQQPQDWLLRDIIHMNARGRLVSAKAVAAWLLPVPLQEN